MEHTINGRWTGSRPGSRFDPGCSASFIIRFSPLEESLQRCGDFSFAKKFIQSIKRDIFCNTFGVYLFSKYIEKVDKGCYNEDAKQWKRSRKGEFNTEETRR